LEQASYIILPGVGAFCTGMRSIRQHSLDQVLKEQVVDKGTPFLGLCLGMQLLGTKGEEGGETPGLGWIPGEVKRLEPQGSDLRIPHVGWNEVVYTQDSPLFKGIPSGKDFYFVHSYHLVCAQPEDAIAQTPYCGGFVSAVGRDRIFGVQFHPEKSQRVGFQVIRNFLLV
jgi:glutamine amidotransferase